MTTVRPPGVYQDDDAQQRHAALALYPTGIPGFVGITQKGPLDQPVRVTGMESFARVFGHQDVGSPFETSLKGFFENGGRECYVIRVAHRRENGPGVPARAASADVRDPQSRRRYLVRAASEGSWGNSLRFRVERQVGRQRTFLTLDVPEGETVLTLRSVAGLSRGTLLRIYDDERSFHAQVVEVAGKQGALDRPAPHVLRSGAPTNVESIEFDVTVRSKDEQEVYRNLQVAPFGDAWFVRVLGERSRLVRVEDLSPEIDLADAIPADRDWTTLEGGEDGIAGVSPADFIGGTPQVGVRTGLQALEDVEAIDLVVIPDLLWCLEHSSGFRTAKDVEIVQQEVIAHCERLRDRVALLDVPNSADLRSAIQWRKMFDSPYGAFYYPWITVLERGKRVALPPSGHVAGVLARIDRERGVFHPPANEVLEGVVDLEQFLHDAEMGELNREGVNCLRSFPTRGVRIWGARTASSDPMQRYLNVRREISAIIKTLARDLQWVVFEPNNEGLWKRVSMDVQFFLVDLWRQGWFRGSTPEDAFFVKCDDENNPPEARDAGTLVVDVGVSPVRPTEYVTFSITQTAEEPQGPGVGV